MKNIIKISLLGLISISMTTAPFRDLEEPEFLKNIEAGKLTDKNLISEQVKKEYPHGSPDDNTSPLDMALVLAAIKGKTNAVKTLIGLGAQNQNNAALMAACQQGFSEIVTQLLAITKDVNLADEKGNTVLMHSIPDPNEGFDFKFMNAMAAKGYTLSTLPQGEEERWFQDQTNNVYAPIARQLIKAGALVNKKNNNGETPLIKACRSHNKPMAKVFIDANANVNEQDQYGKTPLAAICSHGRIDTALIKMLLDAKADVNAGRYTALMELASNGSIKYMDDKGRAVALMLIKAGTNLEKEDSDGNTALMYAAKDWNPDLISILIGAKVNIHKRNKNGDTVLILAAENNIGSAVKLFIQHKVNVNIQNNNGDTALIKVLSFHLPHATSESRFKLAEALINAGTDVNKQNKRGDTALTEAAHLSDLALMKLLLKAKANPNKKNNEGESALSITKRHIEQLSERNDPSEANDEDLLKWRAEKLKTSQEIYDLLEAAEKEYAQTQASTKTQK